jgi:hypothetical protein
MPYAYGALDEAGVLRNASLRTKGVVNSANRKKVRVQVEAVTRAQLSKGVSTDSRWILFCAIILWGRGGGGRVTSEDTIGASFSNGRGPGYTV